ncbi:MAG: FHA domain-containing protein [Anaerolineales bacterium]
MVSQNPLIRTMFNEFVIMRQSGLSRDEAWDRVRDITSHFDQEQTETLLQMAREWEAKLGHKYRPRQDAHATLTQRPTEVDDGLPAPGSPALVARLAPSESMNEAMYETTQVPASPGDEATTEPYHFDDQSVLWLYFQDFPNRLQYPMSAGKQLVIGRRTPNSVMTPDVDLSPFQGERFGISRMHATIERRGNRLYIYDLGSLNFTFLNGERLQAHEVRAIRHGDRLRFASLEMMIEFGRQQA